jgi:hypothetical protein
MPAEVASLVKATLLSGERLRAKLEQRAETLAGQPSGAFSALQMEWHRLSAC